MTTPRFPLPVLGTSAPPEPRAIDLPDEASLAPGRQPGSEHGFGRTYWRSMEEQLHGEAAPDRWGVLRSGKADAIELVGHGRRWLLAVTRRAVGELAHAVARCQGLPNRARVLPRRPGHIGDPLPRPEMRRGIAVTIQTPAHG